MLNSIGIKFCRFFALIVKEFHSVWRDPKSRSLLFLPPILQLFLFSHAATLDITNIRLAVLDEDKSPVTREFLSRAASSKYFSKIIYAENLAELRRMLDSEAVRGAVYIKNDFTRRLKSGRGAELELILDGRHTNGSQIIGNYLGEIAAGFSGGFIDGSGTARGFVTSDNCNGDTVPAREGPLLRSPYANVLRNDGIKTSTPGAISTDLRNSLLRDSVPRRPRSATASGSTPGAIRTDLRNWYNPNLYYHWFIISSLAGILPMSMVLLLSALSLAREKETGTFDELLVSPLKPYEILAGKLVIPLFFGLIDGVLILAASRFIFHVPYEGSFLLYLFALSVFLISISGAGLFISSLVKTQQQAILGVFVFMFPAMILSGYSAPVENITPRVLQNLTVINPLRFFLVISKGIILKDFSFQSVMLNLIPIIFIAFFTLSTANFSFKNKLD